MILNCMCNRWVASAGLVAAFSLAATGADDVPTITVVGEAEVLVAPDVVKVSVGIQSRAKTVAAATEEVDKKLKGVLEFLKSSGIEDKHIQTQFISIDPILRDEPEHDGKGYNQRNNANADPFSNPAPSADGDPPIAPIGYSASRQLLITVVDLKKFETIYKGLVERGINRTEGLHFTSSQINKHRDTARLAAVRDARDKAHAMARELGATLASIKTMREADRPSPYGYRGGMIGGDPFGGGSDEAISGGEMSVKSSVEVVFVLGGAEMPK